MAQDEDVFKESAKELGAEYFELFTAIIVNRTYADVMDNKNTVKTKTRLGEVRKNFLNFN